MTHSAHFVQLFDADDALVDAVSRFVHEGIEADWTCVVLATTAHRELIAARLQSMGLDPAALAAEYRYIALDAHLILLSFMSEEGPDQQRFHQNMGLLMRQAASRGQPVRVFGEMVGLLTEEGRAKSAIRLEELWNELSRQQNFTLFCAYPMAPLVNDLRTRTLIRALHTHVVQREH
jgi:KaiC/GvpD/RAD55 family RecA-like ATPase